MTPDRTQIPTGSGYALANRLVTSRILPDSFRTRVSVRAGAGFAPESSLAWEGIAGIFCDPVSPEVVESYQFVFDSPQVRASVKLADYALESFTKGALLLAGAQDLMRRIFRDFRYDPKATTVDTPLEEVLKKRRGVCQDFAHVMLGLCRTLRIPAVYVRRLSCDGDSQRHACLDRSVCARDRLAGA